MRNIEPKEKVTQEKDGSYEIFQELSSRWEKRIFCVSSRE